MKKIAPLLAALICLQVSAIAVPDSVTMGPYNISFDLGLPHDAYRVEINEPRTTETLGGIIQKKYSLSILNRTGITRIAVVSLTEANQSILTPDEMADSTKNNMLISGYKNVDVATRQIDGKKAL